MYLGQKGVATILIGAHQGLIGSADERRRGRQLPGRRGDPAALLRAPGRGAAGDLGDEEARRQPRADDPRVPLEQRPDYASASRCASSAACSRACRSTKAPDAATQGRAGAVIADRSSAIDGVLLLARDRARTPRRRERCCSPLGIRRRVVPDVRGAAATSCDRGRRRAAAARRGAVAPQQRAALQRAAGRAAAVVRPAGAGPDAARRGLGGHRAKPCGRSATSRCSSVRCGVATLVSAVRTALRAARAAVPDPRAPGRTRARRGVAAARRPAQGRVPGHARPRAAQSAGAAADRPAAAAGGRRRGPAVRA